MKTGLKRTLGLVVLCLGFNAFAAEKITIMVSGIDKLIYLPAKLAEQLGYLKETGLDIELLSEPAGSNAETEMLSGVAHGVIGFYDHTLSLQARGKDAAYIDGVFVNINTGTFFISMIAILVCAVLGGWFGQRMMKKHFIKAGIA